MIHDEPVRGDIPAPGYHALPGIDRARAYLYGLVPSNPIHHLFGIKPTQAGPGTAVVAMPNTPWLAHANGHVSAIVAPICACRLAAHTVADPNRLPILRSFHHAQVRLISSRSTTFVARAEVIRSAQAMAFCRVTCEDGEGRLLANGTAAVELVDFDDGAPPPTLKHVDAPRYPTPDPYERPVPPEHTWTFHPSIDDPLGTQIAMSKGDRPDPPAAALIGFSGARVSEGRLLLEVRASRWHRWDRDVVDASVLAESAMAATGGAAQSLMPRALPGILSYDIQFVREVPADGRRVTIDAEAERHGDYVLTSALIGDDDGLVGRVSFTALVIPTRPDAGRPAERRLASVLFTDIVASTASAERMGDARWRTVLDEHNVIVRNALTRHGGREVKTTGDGFLATFDTPTDAVRCASAIRAGVSALGIETKAGIHCGEVEVYDGDVSGTTVNVAARVLECAGAGEIVVSRTVRDLAAGSDLRFADHGVHPAKGLSEDLHLYALGT